MDIIDKRLGYISRHFTIRIHSEMQFCHLNRRCLPD